MGYAGNWFNAPVYNPHKSRRRTDIKAINWRYGRFGRYYRHHGIERKLCYYGWNVSRNNIVFSFCFILHLLHPPKKVWQHFSLLNNGEQAFIGMVKTSQILHVYASNLAQWIINICQIQNQWKCKKQRAQIYYVYHYVMWTCRSKISSGLQIIHQNRFKMHFEPATLVCECLYQSTNIINSITIHLCPHLYNRCRVEKIVLISSVWHNNQCVTWTPET